MVGMLIGMTIVLHRPARFAGPIRPAGDRGGGGRLAARLLPAAGTSISSCMEMGPRAATFGKRAVGLRVVARSGERLTADRVIARNLMREIEFYLPLSSCFYNAAESGSDGALIALAGLVWTGLFLFFPLFNKDRMRVGDLLAGTWVISAPRQASSAVDLLGRRPAGRARAAPRSPTRSSTSTACSSCRRWSRCCARAATTSDRHRRRGDPRQDRPGRMAARITTSCALITTPRGRGWSAACCSASAARTNTTAREREPGRCIARIMVSTLPPGALPAFAGMTRSSLSITQAA